MLTHLTVAQFALAEYLDADFAAGTTVLTGETGAGKSLVVDALGMALGDRGDAERIRSGADKAEVAATFAIAPHSGASGWLAANDYAHDGECLLRRTLTREGRSRGFINGQPATMQQLQALGEQLIDIHSQHEHQSLLRRDTHRRLLDDFAGAGALGAAVAAAHHTWRDAAARLAALQSNAEALGARRDLVGFQLDELARLDLRDGEIAELEREQRLLAGTDAILATAQQVLALCDGGDGDGIDLGGGLGRASQLLEAITDRMPALAEVQDLLDSARIQVTEAVRELRHQVDGLELDPTRLRWVEDRLGAAHQLARKHRVAAAELVALRRQLDTEMTALDDVDSTTALAATVAALRADYLRSAGELAAVRAAAAPGFCAAVNAQLSQLAMAGADVEIALTALDPDHQGAQGTESAEILLRTNPGQPHRPLARVASGGELSRISLAIQVVAAQHSTIPTLVFDEVDVGIGGATATVVGQLLRRLGEAGQVICVTHLPQVASAAHHHLAVRKSVARDSATSALHALQPQERVAEIARMLGGKATSPQTLAHAREMLGHATGY